MSLADAGASNSRYRVSPGPTNETEEALGILSSQIQSMITGALTAVQSGSVTARQAEQVIGHALLDVYLVELALERPRSSAYRLEALGGFCWPRGTLTRYRRLVIAAHSDKIRTLRRAWGR